MNGDNQNHLRDMLKGLPKVKAKNDFDNRLMKRLREVDDEKYHSPAFKKLQFPGKRFSLSGLLKPSLAPAIGLTIVLLVFIAYYINVSIIQKSPVDKNISQNSSGEQKDLSPVVPNTESQPPISSNEPNRQDKGTSRSNTQSTPGDVLGNDQYAPPVSQPEKRLEEQILTPKSEEKKTDELRSSERKSDNVDIKEKKADDYIMKKSGDYQYKDTGKQNEINEEEDHAIEGDRSKGPVDENSLSKDSLNKNDSSKVSTKKDKKVAKGKIYNDTVKSPIETIQQTDDTTKNKK